MIQRKLSESADEEKDSDTEGNDQHDISEESKNKNEIKRKGKFVCGIS